MIVADCNLIAYLLIEGEHTPAAEAVLLRDPDWVAPFLWRSELRNVLVNHVRHRSLSRGDAHGKMSEAEDLLGERSLGVSSTRVLDEAISRGISAYDAEYVALAVRMDVPLLTLDRKLCLACPKVALLPSDFAGSA